MVTQNGETISIDRELERRNVTIGDDNTLPQGVRSSKATVAKIVSAVRQYERQSEVALRESKNAEAAARAAEAEALRNCGELMAKLQKAEAELLKFRTEKVAESFVDDDGAQKLTQAEQKRLVSAASAE